MSFNLLEHMAGQTFVPATSGMGYERVLSPHRRPYRTKDGHIGLLPYTTAHWQRFFELAGMPEHADDPRFKDPVTRSENINALYAILAEIVSRRTTAQWQDLLKDADIPMAPIATLDELLHDPHLERTGFFSRQTHPSEGEIRSAGIPVTFSRTPIRLADSRRDRASRAAKYATRLQSPRVSKVSTRRARPTVH